MDNKEELLKEIDERLIRIERNQVQGRKVRIIVCSIILVLLIILAVIIVPRLMATLNEISAVTNEAQKAVEVLDGVDMISLKEKLDVLSGIDTDKLQDAVNTFETIDFSELQESMENIQSSIESIQNILNFFR